MTDALAFETVRVRTVRSTYWLLGLAVLLGGLVAVPLTLATRAQALDEELLGVALTGGASLSPLPFAAALVGILGIFSIGHEYRHGTIQPTLVAVPRRSQLLGAKLLVVGALAALTTLLSMAVNWLILVAFRGEVVGFVPAEVVAGYVLFVVLWGIVGTALALLLRNIPGALVVLLLVPLVVEPLLRGLAQLRQLDWLAPIVPYLPFTAGSSLVNVVGPEFQEVTDWDRWEGGGIFAAAIAVVLAAAWTLFERRDA